MNVPLLLKRAGAVIFATVLLGLSATMAWATAFDYGHRVNVPKGVFVAGTDLSGMTKAQARAAIMDAVEARLSEPIKVTVDGESFTFEARRAITVDVDAMLTEAFAPRRRAAFVARLRHDVGGATLPTIVKPAYTVDRTIIAEWIQTVAREVDRPAVAASLTIESSEVLITPARSGRRLRVKKGMEVLAGALAAKSALSGKRAQPVELPIRSLEASVTEDDFGKTIVVDLSQRRIRLFDGADLEKSYPCAIGTPSYPTPTGHFEIVLKRYMPTWVNPAPNGWGKDMPRMIPPGRGNPLGTRALNISASGIRFHGTDNIGSVGTAASHGCMRMVRRDIEDLYERVEVGTQVYIVD